MVPGPGKELVGVFLLLLAFREMWMVNCLAFKYCVGELVKQVFTCTDRGISELKEAVSDIPTHVRVLNVSVNKIRTLHHRGLENLTQLELLRLDKNNLTTIDIEAFWKLSNLQLLNLSCNQLETLKPGIFKFLPNLTNLILKQNKLTSFLGESVFALKRLRVLDISSNSLRNVSSFFKALSSCTGLRTLNAENNNISALEISSYFPPNLTHLLLARNVISQLWAPAAFFANIIYLDLSFNNLSSSKELTSHTFTRLQFLNVQHNPLGKDGVIDIVQNLNAPLVNINLSNLTLNDKATLGKLCKFIQKKRIQRLELRGNRLHQKGKWSFHYGYYLLRAWIHENKLQKNSTKGYKFDAFVSYNSKDEAWVFDQLMNNLENEGPPFHQLCFHHRDFEVGKPIVENIVDAIYKSRKTICIISKNYLQSEWCSMEMQVALYRLFDEHSDVLILVFLEEIPGHVLSSYHHLRKLVRKKTYINWPADESGQKLFWTKLRDALKKVHTASDESIPQLTHCTI
ncbi:toll-like receptor 13 isoform X2 [Rhincodon typus]|uniref:toll-like receptor 13 isoform X2 n=1 Tax=Rhincodon typus TaxID=259920 RepID=UPI00202E370B|nr:toll-like receptor 13 isoform X2 [Rhincodon typus]